MQPNRPVLRGAQSPNQIKKLADDTVDDLIQRGRLLAEHNVPSFIPGLRSSTTLVTDKCPSVAIDKYWRTYWNPKAAEWMAKAALAVSAQHPCHTCKATSHQKYAYIAGIWVHEVGHQVFQHGFRTEEAGYTDAAKANIAQDAEMNDDIPEIGQKAQAYAQSKGNHGQPCPAMCLPSRVMVNRNEWDAWNALGSEDYSRLIGKPVTMWDIVRPVGAGLSGDEEIPFLVFPDDMPVDVGVWIPLPKYKLFEVYYESMPDPKPQSGKGKGQGAAGGQPGQGKPGPGKGIEEMVDHGSGSGGAERSWEQGKPGEGNNASGITEAESTSVRRDIATQVKDPSKTRGTTPAGWEVWADTVLLPPKVRWEDKLRSMARMAINRVRGERMNTFRRLARSSIVNNCAVVKPTTYDVVPTVVIVVDTSGSMGSGQGSPLERALSECEAILKLNKVKAFFLDCDANVYGKAQDVKSISKAKVHGGGGTDMSIGVRAALKNKPKPHMVVLLTDGYTPWPSMADLQGVKIITAIAGGCKDVPGYMNPVWIDD